MQFYEHLKAVKKKNPMLGRADDEKIQAPTPKFIELLEGAFQAGYAQGQADAAKASPSLFDRVFGRDH